MSARHLVSIDDRRFTELLHRWNHHQDLRSAGAPIVELAASRARLDDAREQMRRAA